MTIAEIVSAVRDRRPLVHCCTNVVSGPTIADGLLAAGASPVMTIAPNEVASVAAGADALLINLGTLTVETAYSTEISVRAAVATGVPWVLDPPGILLGTERGTMALDLLARQVAVLRCNASEALALAGSDGGGRGPDATASTESALPAAQELARRFHTVVALSGDVDVITDGERVARIGGGHRLLTLITGTGCTLGGLTAACTAVAEPWDAAVAAHAWMAVAAQRAAQHASAPGTFKAAWMDGLYAVTGAEVEQEAQLA